MMSADAISAAVSRTIVMRLSTSGVSQDHWRVASHERMPVATEPEAMALIMHCMHIAGLMVLVG